MMSDSDNATISATEQIADPQASETANVAAGTQQTTDTGGGGDGGDAVDKIAGLLGAEQPAAGEQKETEGDGTDANEEAKPEIEYTDFGIADNLRVDDETMALAKSTFKEYGLTQEQAQKLIDLQNDLTLKQNDIAMRQIEAQQQEILNKWEAEVKADPELGGADFYDKMAIARSAAVKLGCPEALYQLSEAKMTNNPAIIRLLYRAGKALGESAYPQGNVASGERDLIEIMYEKSNMR